MLLLIFFVGVCNGEDGTISRGPISNQSRKKVSESFVWFAESSFSISVNASSRVWINTESEKLVRGFNFFAGSDWILLGNDSRANSGEVSDMW